MTENTRNKAFLFLLLAGIGILLLSMGLADLQLMDGLPFPSAVEWQAIQPEGISYGDAIIEGRPYLWVRGLLAFGLLVLVGCFVFWIIFQKHRVRIRPILISLSVVAGMIVLVALLPSVQGGTVVSAPDQISIGPSSTMETSPVGNPPSWLLWLVAAGSIGLVFILGFWLIRQAVNNNHRISPVVLEAENALAAIQAGSDLSEVVVRCYLRMNQAVLEERGFEREEMLTPREFEISLATKGVPVEPLRALTRLFEDVRYGRKTVDQQSEKMAVACLTAIIQYCKVEGAGQ